LQHKKQKEVTNNQTYATRTKVVWVWVKKKQEAEQPS